MNEETQKTVRSKKSANYALEQMLDRKEHEIGCPLWQEIKDGFVSPEKALDYAREKMIQGAVRVVRVVTPVYGGDLVTPEPVYTLKKIEAEQKPVASKKTRKPRQVKDESVTVIVSPDPSKTNSGPNTFVSPTSGDMQTHEAPPFESVAPAPVRDALPSEVVEALPPDEGLNPDAEEES